MIPLTRGKFVIVDDEDYDHLNQWKWFYDGRYATRTQERPKRTSIRMHQIIAKHPGGRKIVTDHINGNKLDNRKKNLRLISQSRNTRNSRYKKSSSRYRGVAWDKLRKRWKAFAFHGGRIINIGRYDSEIEAVIARDRMVWDLFHDRSLLNLR